MGRSSNLKRKAEEVKEPLGDQISSNSGKKKRKYACKYCGTSIDCDSEDTMATATIRSHMLKCKMCPIDVKNTFKCEPNAGGGEEAGTRTVGELDQEGARKALARVVVVHGLPFKFVEGEEFKEFCARVQPQFEIPMRETVVRDCVEIFEKERVTLRDTFNRNRWRVCLSAKTWTSIQECDYVCITAHYIDNDWKFQRKILNFVQVPGHDREAIGKAIDDCICERRIRTVMTLTVDDDDSNDCAVAYVKELCNIRNWLVLKGEFLRIRCVGRIVDLVANYCLELVNNLVNRVRSLVTCVRQSPDLLKRFESFVGAKSCLCRDVPSRWNSTYTMLDAAQKLQRAFRFVNGDASSELNEFGEAKSLGSGPVGKPSDEDWEKVRILFKFLGLFYDLKRHVSSSLNATSNISFQEISNVHFLLEKWCKGDDSSLSLMAQKVKEKYGEYWGDPENLNVMLFIPVVLDPRYKFQFVDFIISQLYESNKGLVVKKKVKETLYALFDDYNKKKPHSKVQLASSSQPISGKVNEFFKKFEMWDKAIRELEASKSELVKYLEENRVDNEATFDVLEWWKNNSSRFPVLSQVARDVLAIPFSAIPSDSMLDISGHVLYPFRSSLTPKIADALICAQDWLRGSSLSSCAITELDDIKTMEEVVAGIDKHPS